ncbi:MAG: sulfotransferase [Candidatus Aminicenantes bacterium]|nr:sulfotransferase [Candidatus Aminicenantes bacterium]
MPKNSSLILVCGLPRSGTTYIGKALAKTKDVHYLHEPLNKDFGVKGIHNWYPFINETGDGDGYQDKNMIDDIIHLNTTWTYTAPMEYGRMTRLSKALWGGRSGLNWIRLRWKKQLGIPIKTTCLKDPFATFSSGYFNQQFKAKIVCMIRHPGAVYMSYKRLNFKTRIESLFKQQHFRSMYAEDIRDDLWERAKNETCSGTALLWKLMSRYVDIQSRNTEAFLLIRHEDFCLHPESMMEKICAFTKVPFENTVKRFIRRTTQIKEKDTSRNPPSGFKRNSRQLIHSWRNIMNEHEKTTIQDIIGEDLLKFYKKW